MKKLALIFVILLAASFTMQAQLLTMTLADGLVGVDSINGATTTYYYLGGSSATQNSIVTPHGLKATRPITQYEIHSVMAGTAHSLVTASDSTAISFEVSYDNTNWFQFPKVPGTSIGTGAGAPTIYTYTTYALLRYVQWVPDAGTCIFPYARVKMVNSAAGAKYPKAYIILKKL
jgi:hypothetical protein